MGNVFRLSLAPTQTSVPLETGGVRESYVARAVKALSEGRGVALLGPEGSGKSAIAFAATRALARAGQFAGGTLVVRPDGQDDLLVLDETAALLGVDERQDHDLFDRAAVISDACLANGTLIVFDGMPGPRLGAALQACFEAAAVFVLGEEPPHQLPASVMRIAVAPYTFAEAAGLVRAASGPAPMGFFDRFELLRRAGEMPLSLQVAASLVREYPKTPLRRLLVAAARGLDDAGLAAHLVERVLSREVAEAASALAVLAHGPRSGMSVDEALRLACLDAAAGEQVRAPLTRVLKVLPLEPAGDGRVVMSEAVRRVLRVLVPRPPHVRAFAEVERPRLLWFGLRAALRTGEVEVAAGLAERLLRQTTFHSVTASDVACHGVAAARMVEDVATFCRLLERQGAARERQESYEAAETAWRRAADVAREAGETFSAHRLDVMARDAKAKGDAQRENIREFIRVGAGRDNESVRGVLRLAVRLWQEGERQVGAEVFEALDGMLKGGLSPARVMLRVLWADRLLHDGDVQAALSLQRQAALLASSESLSLARATLMAQADETALACGEQTTVSSAASREARAQPMGAGTAAYLQGLRCASEGDYREAVRRLSHAAASFRSARFARGVMICELHMAASLLRAGDDEGLDRLLSRLAPMKVPSVYPRQRLHALLAHVAWRRGDALSRRQHEARALALALLASDTPGLGFAEAVSQASFLDGGEGAGRWLSEAPRVAFPALFMVPDPLRLFRLSPAAEARTETR